MYYGTNTVGEGRCHCLDPHHIPYTESVLPTLKWGWRGRAVVGTVWYLPTYW